MGRKKSRNGGRRRGRGRGGSAGAQERGDAAHNRAGAGAAASGSSRLLLTRLLREGVVWDVYIATTSQPGSPNITRLEFESGGTGRQKERHTRPVRGSLLEALHTGAPVSRRELEEELERAIGGEAGERAPPASGD